MIVMLKGITVTLMEKQQTGTDGFNRPVYEETTEIIDNVLVAPSSEQEVLDSLNLTGRKAVYTLGIPKGDTHDWTDKDVVFFGVTWHTIGMPVQGIDAMIPLDWNRKVQVERYESAGESQAQ